MIITLWAILLGFSFLILVLGHFTNIMMSDIFVIVGYFLIFMLGGIMIFNGVYFYGGTTTTTTNTYYEEYDAKTFKGFVVLRGVSEEKIEDTPLVPYETGSGIIQYVDNARMIGLFILLIGAFGFITFWIDNRKYKQLKNEEFEEVGFEEGFKEGDL